MKRLKRWYHLSERVRKRLAELEGKHVQRKDIKVRGAIDHMRRVDRGVYEVDPNGIYPNTMINTALEYLLRRYPESIKHEIIIRDTGLTIGSLRQMLNAGYVERTKRGHYKLADHMIEDA